MRIIITDGDRPGEGWAFLYEHITLDRGVNVGDAVTAGQRIGVSAITVGANHMALEYLFNDFQFTKDHRCWAEHRAVDGNQAFVKTFDSIKNTPQLLGSWRDVREDGMFSYRAALDAERFPDGPRLCYPMGTDLRVPG